MVPPRPSKTKAAVYTQAEGPWARSPKLCHSLSECAAPIVLLLCVCVFCLFHQVDFQGHDHALIIILYIPSGTGQAHSRSAIDVEGMNSLRKLFSQRSVGGF